MIGGQEVGETNEAPGGWVAGRPGGWVDGGHVHKPALPGPTCKLELARSKRVVFQVGAECGNTEIEIQSLVFKLDSLPK